MGGLAAEVEPRTSCGPPLPIGGSPERFLSGHCGGSVAAALLKQARRRPVCGRRSESARRARCTGSPLGRGTFLCCTHSNGLAVRRSLCAPARPVHWPRTHLLCTMAAHCSPFPFWLSSLVYSLSPFASRLSPFAGHCLQLCPAHELPNWPLLFRTKLLPHVEAELKLRLKLELKLKPKLKLAVYFHFHHFSSPRSRSPSNYWPSSSWGLSSSEK